jgi:CubicO group peptidase (beta-lactamase class C family)
MKKSFITSLLCHLIVVSVSLRGFAGELQVVKPGTVGLSAEKLDEINQAVDQAVKDGKTAGAIVVVMRKGKVAHFSTHGWQDIEKKRRMQPDTIFRIYSMSKAITTVAAMTLWEEGRFKLDDPVSKYLPEFRNMKVYAKGKGDAAEFVPCKREMTVRDLMRHTSGLTYGGGKAVVDQLYQKADLRGRGLALGKFTKELAKLPLKYQPGSRFEYSYSTDVLGRLVEVWSGKSLDKFFAERIFSPLDMKDTGFAVPDSEIERFASSYGPNPEGGLRVIDAPETSRYRKSPPMYSGGGGLVSTARDYSRFCQMVVGEGELGGQHLLKNDTLQLMTRNHIPKDALPIVQGFPRVGWGFGLGWAVRYGKDVENTNSPIGECRWGGAASTHFWFSPKDELAVVVMQQHRPFIRILETAIKPIVYSAIEK